MHPIRSITLPLLVAVAAAPAHAATVTATITDKSGRPLPGAVLMLEADGAKPLVKPMAGTEIAQTKKTFSPDVTVVTVGTPVTFPNRDTVRHQVYSFSAAKSFELKLYAGTPSTPIVFDKPGVVVIGCNIHDQMAAWVVVVDTPYHARSAASGTARIEGVAAGSYQMRAWHAGLPEGAVLPATAIRVGASDVEQAVRVDAVVAAP